MNLNGGEYFREMLSLCRYYQCWLWCLIYHRLELLDVSEMLKSLFSNISESLRNQIFVLEANLHL